MLFSQSKGLLSEGVGLKGVVDDWGLKAFFQALVDDALLDLDVDDTGEGPLIMEGSRRG